MQIEVVASIEKASAKFALSPWLQLGLICDLNDISLELVRLIGQPVRVTIEPMQQSLPFADAVEQRANGRLQHAPLCASVTFGASESCDCGLALAEAAKAVLAPSDDGTTVSVSAGGRTIHGPSATRKRVSKT